MKLKDKVVEALKEDAENLRRLLIGATSQLVVFGMVICIKERSAEK